MLLLSLLVTLSSIAQQPKYARPANPTRLEMANRQVTGDYTYHAFIAPNKSFGYDILRNGRIIFHQPATAEAPGINKAALTKKEQADKAATLSFDKIKKGMRPELSREELIKIAAH